jgi:hypothetical protein
VYLKQQNMFPTQQLGVLQRRFTASPSNQRKGDEGGGQEDMGGNKENSRAWDLLWAFLLGGGGVAALGVLENYKSSKENVAELGKDLAKILSPDDIKNSSVPPGRVQELEQRKRYVHRTGLEEQINAILSRDEANDHYFILYGSKGCGKSTLVEKCTTGKNGVVSVLVSSVFDKAAILKTMSTEIMGEHAPAVTEKKLVTALHDAKVGGRLATVVFEIERGEGAEQTACIRNVRSLSKMFAQVCNCIIILSEANAILVFGQDEARERYILVPDLSDTEALEYVRARKGGDVDVKDMMRLFDSVGTNAAKLLDFVSRDGSVDEFIADKLGRARQDLVAFQLKPILKALKENPEGVSPEYFRNEEYKAIDLSSPVAVGTAMKGSNAILYDMEDRRYKLISQAHKVALRNYEPIVRK